MLTYSQAERLLAEYFHVGEADRESVFRSRLKNFRKLGVPVQSKPGRGARVWYTEAQLWEWMFCLQLSELGVEPSIAASMLVSNREKILASFERSLACERPVFFVAFPCAMTRYWSDPGIFPGFYDVDFDAEDIDLADNRYKSPFIAINISSAAREVRENLHLYIDNPTT